MADTIKQVKVGTLTYDIEASLLNGSTKDQIINTAIAGAQTSRFEVVSSITAANAKQNIIYLVPSENGDNDVYDEYVLINNALEKIGSTDIDLSGYAKKGDVTSGPNSDVTTESAGGDTITTSGATPSTATGTATITYKKSAAATGSNGDHTHTFTGDTTNVINSVSGDTTTIYSSPSATGSKGDHTHTVSVDSHEHGSDVSVVTSVTMPDTDKVTVLTGVKASGTTAAITAITPSSVSVKTFKDAGPSLTVSNVTVANAFTVTNGVLSLSTTSVGSASGWNPGTLNDVTVLTGLGTPTTKSFVTGVTSNGTASVLKNVTVSKGTAAGGMSAATLTASVSTAGAHTHSISRTSATVVNKVSSTTAAVLTSGSVGKAGAHTHSITLTDTSVTGTASVAIGSHTHSVTIAPHTHSVNSHTHTVQ